MSEAGASDDPDSSREERARQAAAHLQRATLEMIEALRAVLDVAEEAVREPGGVMTVVTETLGGVAEAFAGVAPGWAERARQAATRPVRVDDEEARATAARAAEPPSRHRGGGRLPDRPGLEHIRIS